MLPGLVNRRLGKPFAPDTWLAVRLQEADQPEVLVDEARASAEVAMLRCRLLSDFARDGFRALPADVIEAMTCHPASPCIPDYAAHWRALFEPQSIQTVQRWQRVVGSTQIEPSCMILEAHLGHWTERSPSGDAAHALGADEESAQAYALTPDTACALGVALQVLKTQRTYLDLIERLATAQPAHVPDFIDLGLWLQRRACCAVAEIQGVDFIIEHLSAMRLELVAYVLLRMGWQDGEKRRLRQHIVQAPCFGMSLDKKDVLAIIDGDFDNT